MGNDIRDQIKYDPIETIDLFRKNPRRAVIISTIIFPDINSEIEEYSG